MDSFQITKFAGAFLVSLLLLMGINKIGNVLVVATAIPETAAARDAEIAVDMEADEATAIETAMAEAAAPTFAQLLQGASAEAGAKVAKKCRSCHVITKGGANRVGPAMWNVVGAPMASWADYSYSAAMSAMEGVWGYEELDAFMSGPRTYVPGTKMSFAGIKDPQDRANLIVYLRAQSDAPLPLPGLGEPEIAEPEMADHSGMDGP